MYLTEVRDILSADVLSGADALDQEVRSACGSDFMSDVLAYVKDQALLLTGLVNPQVIRTAEMMDMKCVVFVRGKLPDAQIAGPGPGTGHCGHVHSVPHVSLPAACCTPTGWRGE